MYTTIQLYQGSLVCTPTLIRVRLVGAQPDVVKFHPQVLISGEIHGDERVVSTMQQN
jgi:hypothetical protein